MSPTLVDRLGGLPPLEWARSAESITGYISNLAFNVAFVRGSLFVPVGNSGTLEMIVRVRSGTIVVSRALLAE